MTIVSFESLKADPDLLDRREQQQIWLRELEKPLAVPFTRLWDAIQDDSFTTEEVRLIAENPATARVFMSCYRVSKSLS